MRKGDPDAALNCFHHAVEIDPRDGLIWSLIGETLLKSGKVNQAEEVLRSSLANDCRRAEYTYTVLAQVLVAQQIYPEAKNCYKTALDLNPDFSPAFSGYNNLETFDQLAGGDEILPNVTSYVDDTNSNPLLFLARYQPERNGGYRKFWIYHGQALGRLWRYDEARAAFQRARRDRDKGIWAYFAWSFEGQMGRDRGDYIAARHCFEKAIAIDPRSINCYSFLSSVLFRVGELKNSEKVLRGALELVDNEDGSLKDEL